MSGPRTHRMNEVEPTPDQKRKLEVARVGMMSAAPFYSHFFYSTMREVFTRDIPTAATDGRHLFVNPDYVGGLKSTQAIFVYAHEVDHAVRRHPSRGRHYTAQGKLEGKVNGKVRVMPWSHEFGNVCADYVINAGLVEDKIGEINPDWLWAPDVKGDEMWEDVYARKLPEDTTPPPPPPPPEGDNPCEDGQDGPGKKPNDRPPQPNKKPPTTYRNSGKVPKEAKGDLKGGPNQDILDPPKDPVTGKVDLPSDAEYREAVAAASEVARKQGKLSARLEKMVGEILEPQVAWQDKLRLTITGIIGRRKEDWSRCDRRRLVLNPIVMIPGKRGHGCDTVAVVMDTSGSIYDDPRALKAFYGEITGIINDVRPRNVILIECDADIQRVTEANSLDEIELHRSKGVRGGGGTSFRPPFEYLEKENIRPDALIYLTDLEGSFPKSKPSFPVVWVNTGKGEAPWGETVSIKT